MIVPRWPVRVLSATLAIAAVQLACEPRAVAIDPDARAAYFDLGAWVAHVDSTYAGRSLGKRASVNDVEERTRVEVVDWATELAAFAQANINKPALLGVYRVDSTRDAATDYLTLEYTALDGDAKTRRLRVSCLGTCDAYGRVRAIELEAATSSVLAHTQQRLTWQPAEFKIESRQEILFQGQRELVIEGQVE